MPRVAASLVLCAALFPAAGLAAATPSKSIEKTLPLAPDGRFVLDTWKGRVSLVAWDRAEVSVRATVAPDGSCDDAAELVAKTEVRISGGGREVRVESDYDALPRLRLDWRGDCASRPFVDYEVRLPRGASVRVKDQKSRISADGLGGSFEVESYKGAVRLKGLSGRLDVETYKGDVVAELDRVADGLRVKTYKGEVDLRLAKGARPAVAIDRKLGRRATFETDLQDVPGAPRVTVETEKGTIRLLSR